MFFSKTAIGLRAQRLNLNKKKISQLLLNTFYYIYLKRLDND